MSLALRYSEEVFCDIQDIRCQLNRYESGLGDRFAAQARETFLWIAANPLLARMRKEYRPENLRSRGIFEFPSHLVFYVVGEDHVLIWRVLHGSRDLSQILND